MQGGTPLIENQLAKNRNVLFLCPSYQVIDWIWPKAMDRYAQHCVIVKKTHYLFDFGSAYLKFVPLNECSEKIIQNHKAVIIRHPDLLFEQGRDENLVDLIKHRNQKYGSIK